MKRVGMNFGVIVDRVRAIFDETAIRDVGDALLPIASLNETTGINFHSQAPGGGLYLTFSFISPRSIFGRQFSDSIRRVIEGETE